MKVQKILMMMALALCAVACSDDDDDEVYVVETTPAEEIEGTYTGYTWTSFFYGAYTMYEPSGETVSVTANSDGTAQVVLTSSTWGSWEYSAVTVTEGSSEYTLSGDGTAYMSGHSSVGIPEVDAELEEISTRATGYDATVSGTVSADLQTVELTFYCSSVMSGVTISFATTAAPDSYAVSGSYTVYTAVSFSYISTLYVYTDETVSVSANDDGTVAVSYSNDTWGDYVVDNATVTANSDGSYTIEGDGVATMDAHGTTNNYDMELSATVSSDGTLTSCVFSVPSVMGGTTVTCVEGDAPASYIVAGDYSAYVIVDSGYFSGYVYTDQTLSIAANDDSTVSVTYSSDEWGDYSFSDATVTEESDGSYTISSSDGVATMTGHSGTATNYDATLSATIGSDGTLTSCVITIPSVMNGTTLTFYAGDAPGALLVAGSHTGYVTVSSAFFSGYVYTDQTVTLTAADDYSSVTITYTNSTWGTYTIEDVTVTAADDGTYTLSGSGVASIAAHSSTATNYDVTVTGTAASDGTITSLTFYMSFMGGTNVVFTEGDVPAAYAVAGDYSGTFALSVSGTDAGSVESLGMTIAAEDVDAGTVTLTVDQFDITVAAMSRTMTIGTIAIPSVSVSTEDNETYTLSCSSFSVEDVTYTVSDTTTTITVVGSVSGTITSDGAVSLTFTMTLGAMPLPITATYTVAATSAE